MKIALALVYFVFAILLNSVGTVILQVILSFSVAETEASVLEAFKDLTIAGTSFLIAPFLPRIGYKRALLGAVALAGVACCLMPLQPSFNMAKVLFFLCGFAFAFAKVSIYSSVALVTNDAREHASFMSVVEGVFMVGVLSGYWIFSFFIDAQNPESPSWLKVYWLLAGLCAVTVVAVLVTPFSEPEVSKDEKVNFGEDFAKMVKLMIRPLVLIFILSAFLYVLIEQGIGTWLPTFNNKILGLPSAMSVQATSIFAATLAFGRLSAGSVLKRFGWYKVLNMALVSMGVLVVVTLPLTEGLSPNPDMTWSSAPVAAFIFPLIGLFMSPIYPALSSVMLSSLPKRMHSSMTGLIVIFSALGGSTGSIITGYVFGHFSGQTAFYFSLIPICGLLVTIFFFRRATKDLISPEEQTFGSAGH
ncbi:MAG TPA: MFS transporter [Phycisphaerales bacterium]|nr:MFS transporter [Phycisphaerales bacterium]